MIKLSLPLPPSINHSHITTKSGKRIRSNTTIRYEESVGWYCFENDIGCHRYKDTKAHTKQPLIKEKCYMDLWFYFPDKRRRDTHNCLKILLDSLEGIIYEDDKMVLPRIQDFQIDKKNPRVEIEIREKEVK